MMRARKPVSAIALATVVAAGIVASLPAHSQAPQPALSPRAAYSMQFNQAWSEGRTGDALKIWQDRNAYMAREDGRASRSNLPVMLLYQLGRMPEFIEEAKHYEAEQQRVRATTPEAIDITLLQALAVAYGLEQGPAAAYAEVHRVSGLPGASPIVKMLMAASGQLTALGAKDREQLVLWLGEMGKAFPPTAELTSQLVAGLDKPADSLAGLQAQVKDPATSPEQLANLAPWLAYYGDAEGALTALRAQKKRALGTSDGASPLWLAVYTDVRRLPGFKQMVRDLGFVELWNETGWGEYCRPVGSDDFECR